MAIHRIHRTLSPETPFLPKQVAKTQRIPFDFTSRMSSLGSPTSETPKILTILIQLPGKCWKWIIDLFKAKDEEIGHLKNKVKNLKKAKRRFHQENNRLELELNTQAVRNRQENTSFTPLLDADDDEDPILMGSISSFEQSIDFSLQLDAREEELEKRAEKLEQRKAELNKHYQETLTKLKTDLQKIHEKAEEKAEREDVKMLSEIQALRTNIAQLEDTIRQLTYQGITDEERKEDIDRLKVLKQELEIALEERKKLDESIRQGIKKYAELTTRV